MPKPEKTLDSREQPVTYVAVALPAAWSGKHLAVTGREGTGRVTITHLATGCVVIHPATKCRWAVIHAAQCLDRMPGWNVGAEEVKRSPKMKAAVKLWDTRLTDAGDWE